MNTGAPADGHNCLPEHHEVEVPSWCRWPLKLRLFKVIEKVEEPRARERRAKYKVAC